jgi:hypothetical protein
VLKDAAGVELPPATRKTIDLEGRVENDGVRKAIKHIQIVLADLVHAILAYRKNWGSKALYLQDRITLMRFTS